jgi:hypothetical protein
VLGQSDPGQFRRLLAWTLLGWGAAAAVFFLYLWLRG